MIVPLVALWLILEFFSLLAHKMGSEEVGVVYSEPAMTTRGWINLTLVIAAVMFMVGLEDVDKQRREREGRGYYGDGY
jgi:hypothetical protein